MPVNVYLSGRENGGTDTDSDREEPQKSPPGDIQRSWTDTGHKHGAERKCEAHSESGSPCDMNDKRLTASRSLMNRWSSRQEWTLKPSVSFCPSERETLQQSGWRPGDRCSIVECKAGLYFSFHLSLPSLTPSLWVDLVLVRVVPLLTSESRAINMHDFFQLHRFYFHEQAHMETTRNLWNSTDFHGIWTVNLISLHKSQNSIDFLLKSVLKMQKRSGDSHLGLFMMQKNPTVYIQWP